MRVIHIADLHFDEKSKNQAKAEFNFLQIIDYCKKNTVDGVIIAGDIWDNTQDFGNRSGVSLFFKLLHKLSKAVKFVFIIKGNNAHDNPESVELLNGFMPNVYAYEYNVALGLNFVAAKAVDLLRNNTDMPINLIIHGLPYPTKQNILSNNSIDAQNTDFVNLYEKVLGLHGLFSEGYPNIPKITVFHGNVSGARLSNGQTLIGQDIIIPDFALRKTKANYYALGHIHLPQQVAPDMYYSGSLYNKDFGEIEQKSFNVIEFNGSQYRLTQVPFVSSKPMIIVNAKFQNGEFIYENHLPTNAEIKFRYEITENERAILSKEMLNQLAEKLGGDVKFEAKVVPNERESRSENIMHAKTLMEEVIEYGKVINEEVSESILEKVSQMEIEL